MKLKRVLAGIMAVCVLYSAMPNVHQQGILAGGAMNANAAELDSEISGITIDGFEYSINFYDGSIVISGYSGSETSVEIPASIDGLPVTSIGEYAFEGCTGLKSITIPNSVTSIGKYAFFNCISLTSIEIPDSVTSIGYSAFERCKSLESITIPDSVTSIGEYAFDGCAGLKSITIPNSVTSIGKSAFFNCISLTSIEIPDSVTSIGDSAFQWCSGLTSIIIPYSITSIGRYAFQNCDNLASITIPDSVTSIEQGVFEFCTGLKTIEISEKVTSIGEYAFNGCTGLKSITIPDSVTSIGKHAFYNCTSLTSIEIPDGVTSIEKDVFGHCESLASITIPESVTSIGFGAFCNCTELKSITIPDNVTSIESWVFGYCESLESITIPDGVTSIGYSAFNGCTGLEKLYINKTPAEWKNINIAQGNDILNNVDIVFISNSIKLQPSSVTAIADTTAEFTVTATGKNLKYQWQYSRDNGKTWVNSTNASSKTSTFKLVAAANRNNYLCRCIVTDGTGVQIISDSAKLTVKQNLSITKQPVSVKANVNKTAEFTVTATGKNLKYQWQYSRDNGKTWVNCSNESSKTNTFKLVAAANRNNYLCRCIIIDDVGAQIISNSAKLTIKQNLSITEHPVSVKANANKIAEFTVTATGENLKYQWQYSRDNGKTWIDSTNASSNTNTFKWVAAANRNNYLCRCIVTDDTGAKAISNSAVLTVIK